MSNVDRESALSSAYQRLGEAYSHAISGTFAAGEQMPLIAATLEQVRKSLSDVEWKHAVRGLRDHPMVEVLHQDPFTGRCFEKPRGYAGDAVMLDYIYGHGSVAHHLAGSTRIGREIFSYTGSGPASSGVFERRQVLANIIDEKMELVGGGSVLSVACGHLRELELSSAASSGSIKSFIAIDQDVETIRELQKLPYNWLEPVNGSVIDLLAGRIPLQKFDLVYAAGLFDYLTDSLSIKLLRRFRRLLTERGTIVVANFKEGICDRAYMECCMDWWLRYRTENDMRVLGERAGLAAQVSTDRLGQVVYLHHEL